MSLLEVGSKITPRSWKESRSAWLWGVVFGFLLLGALIIGATVVLTPTPGRDVRTGVAVADDNQANRDPGTSRRTAIVQAAERVGPSVVTISVVQTRLVQSTPFGSEFFEPFFQIPSYRYREQIPS